MTGQLPRVPASYFPCVDVRDVADAHIAALKSESNLRYALSEDTYKMLEIAETLSDEFGKFGYPVSLSFDCLSTYFI